MLQKLQSNGDDALASGSGGSGEGCETHNGRSESDSPHSELLKKTKGTKSR